MLSEVYDCIKGDPSGSISDQHIEKDGYELVLVKEPGDSELSDYDEDLLNDLAKKHLNDDYSRMIDIVHELPEWHASLLALTSSYHLGGGRRRGYTAPARVRLPSPVPTFDGARRHDKESGSMSTAAVPAEALSRHLRGLRKAWSSIRSNQGIDRQQREPIGARLCDQHPIERIAMERRKRRERMDVPSRDVQHIEMQDRLVDELVDRLSDLELPERRLDLHLLR